MSIQNYINHVVFVVDASGSMQSLTNETVKVFDAQIAHLSKRSQELNQETRVSVYLFNTRTTCLIYDMDVMRLPSLKNHYRADGGTALIDATLQSIFDLRKTAQLYGDHAFLIYVMTDGEENRSTQSTITLNHEIDKCPENWTLAVLVPNQTGVHEAKKFGFPPANIQVWSAEVGGVEKAGEIIKQATEAFMVGRAQGIRGTKNLFRVDASNLSTGLVSAVLTELRPSEYALIPVRKDAPIREYIEELTGELYRVGSAYYMLTKPVEVQDYKQLLIQRKSNGKVYSGTHARTLLNLPAKATRLAPGDHGDWNIFLQSTSVNRKLLKGTTVIVLK